MTIAPRILAFGLVLATGSLVACRPTPLPSQASSAAVPIRRTLLERQPATDLPGWEDRLYLIEYAPGVSAPLHVHPALGVGLVLAGRFESAFGDEPVSEVRAGQGFVERADLPHRVFRNPSSSEPLRFVVAFTLRQGDEPFYLGASRGPSAPH